MSATSNQKSAMHDDPLAATSRLRQSKKDEAIRKKVEQSLSRKQAQAPRLRHSRKIAGTVSALRPAQALTVKESLTVIEAAQLMAAKRGDCVLVVDEEEHLSGIFTAKDLAYRVVARGLNARATPVSEIMTKNPMCVTADTSAQDALNLMVSRGFRHLPVCNDEADIFGLLDITKCLYEALNKMERAYGSSRKLYDALEGVEREWQNSPVQLVEYMEALREKMSCPDLTTVLGTQMPVQVFDKATVSEVAGLMEKNHTTAVLVMNRQGQLSGIFTSKDIVLRVIAAGLEPEKCPVGRVNTPHPDTALPSTSILDALKKMHDGRYLNLPVVDEENEIVGLVDVLRLTYAILEQINSIEGNAGDGTKFWNALTEDHAESESALSDSLSQAANSHMFQSPTSTPNPDRTVVSPLSPRAPSQAGMSYPDITPGDSASAANEDVFSTLSSRANGLFAFKFTYGSFTHRIRSESSDFRALLSAIESKIMKDRLSLSRSYVTVNDAETNDWLRVAYVDNENDEVLLSCDEDLTESVRLAREMEQDHVKLVVHDGLVKEEPVVHQAVNAVMTTATPPQSRSPKATPSKSAVARYNVGDYAPPKEVTTRRSRRTKEEKEQETEYDLPIPQEMLLPAAITFLGVVILGVFTVTKLTGSHSRY